MRKWFTLQFEQFKDNLVMAIDEVDEAKFSTDNDYNQRLIDLKAQGITHELLADGYPVTHLSSELAIANGQHYGLSVLTETDQLENLCRVLDALNT